MEAMAAMRGRMKDLKGVDFKEGGDTNAKLKIQRFIGRKRAAESLKPYLK